MSNDYKIQQTVGCITLGLTSEKKLHVVVPSWMTGKQLKNWMKQTKKKTQVARESMYNQ